MSSVPPSLPAIGAALPTRIALTWSGVRFGLACSSSATAPETCGAENDVPLIRA